MSLSPTGHETDMVDMLHLLNNNSLIEISVLVLVSFIRRLISFYQKAVTQHSRYVC